MACIAALSQVLLRLREEVVATGVPSPLEQDFPTLVSLDYLQATAELLVIAAQRFLRGQVGKRADIAERMGVKRSDAMATKLNISFKRFKII